MYAHCVKDRDFGKNKTGRVIFGQSYEQIGVESLILSVCYRLREQEICIGD